MEITRRRGFAMWLLLCIVDFSAKVHGFSSICLKSSGRAMRRMSTGTSEYSRSMTLSAGGDDDEQDKEALKLEKATKAMTAFTNKYLSNTCTTLCSDKSIPAVVIKGLAEHKIKYGSPLCPCRFYDDKAKEAKDGYWNCPCVPMRERHECHCMLFLTEDNMFAGKDTVRKIDRK